MKITLLLPRLSYGGASKIISWLANQLTHSGYQVSIIIFYTGEAQQKLHKSINVINLNIKQSKNRLSRVMFGAIKTQKRIMSAIKKVDPEIIVTFGDTMGSLYLLTNLLDRRKIIISERSDPYSVNGFNHKFRRKLFMLADGIVFQTEGAKKYFSKRIQYKGMVIPNPINVKKTQRAPHNMREDKIAFVGRFDIKQKRQDLMVEAFLEIERHYKDIKLFFYGDGEDLGNIRKLVHEKGLLDKVVFAGRVEDIEKHIWDAKVFVLASDYEGIPNALIEAMALGLPVVSTDCSPGGARMLIENGINGIIVPRSDSKAIASAVLDILNNNEVADSFGEKAQKIIDIYSEDKIIKQWKKFIDISLHR